MGRIIAIDYGKKRVGLAVSDQSQIIATPIGTFASAKVVDFLKDYCLKEDVDCFVVGEPRDMKNNLSDSEKYIVPFINRMKKVFPEIKLVRFDERFTSKIAQQAILTAGLQKKKRQDKSLVDTVSAVLILQEYMNYNIR